MTNQTMRQIVNKTKADDLAEAVVAVCESNSRDFWLYLELSCAVSAMAEDGSKVLSDNTRQEFSYETSKFIRNGDWDAASIVEEALIYVQ